MIAVPGTDVLAILARTPQLHHTKTRLAVELGAAGALQAHTALVQDTLQRMSLLDDVTVVLWVTEADDVVNAWAQAHGYALREQPAGDLGRKMGDILSEHLRGGARRVCLTGTDCPLIDAIYVQQAFAALSSADVVLGPAEDGGYGLVGLNALDEALLSALFEGIGWGTSEVLDCSLERVQQAGKTAQCLPLIWDVDTPRDWRRYQRWLQTARE